MEYKPKSLKNPVMQAILAWNKKEGVLRVDDSELESLADTILEALRERQAFLDQLELEAFRRLALDEVTKALDRK